MNTKIIFIFKKPTKNAIIKHQIHHIRSLKKNHIEVSIV